MFFLSFIIRNDQNYEFSQWLVCNSSAFILKRRFKIDRKAFAFSNGRYVNRMEEAVVGIEPATSCSWSMISKVFQKKITKLWAHWPGANFIWQKLRVKFQRVELLRTQIETSPLFYFFVLFFCSTQEEFTLNFVSWNRIFPGNCCDTSPLRCHSRLPRLGGRLLRHRGCGLRL